MSDILESIFSDVDDNKEVVSVKMTVDEFVALHRVSYVLAGEFEKYRDSVEHSGGEIEITRSLFIESIISVSNLLSRFSW